MKLILINGPTGIGKSTTAQKIHQAYPLSFLVDIDALRRYISGYREYKDESKQLSLLVSESIVATYLRCGHDVIIDKVFIDTQTVERFVELGKKYEADVREFVLNASKELVVKRAKARGYRESSLLTPEKVVKFWEETQEYIKKRSQATIVDVETLSEEDVYKYIINKI
ncbi:MAG: AAA family ATPase [Candidatus Pacebacteria bacterium]|nr:AAA family ATPase [Candidatus Paceibacterota bacterium]